MCRLSKIIIIIFLITVVIFVAYSNFIANNTEKETVAISKPIITVLPTATFSNEEVEIIAQTLAGECYDDKLSDKRNVAEVIVNRVSDGGFGRNVIEIVTAPGQFRGYWYQSRPVSKSDIQNNVLNTNRKRHIAGGILLSVSMLFGGLALTVMTIKCEENDNE